MKKHILDKFFNPQAVAIVGASPRKGSIGNYLIRNLQRDGFPGKIYPINPNHETIDGLAAYPSLTSIGSPVDLAVIAVPIAGVPEIIRECGGVGIPGAIIISAGGKEVGREGQAIEEEIQAAAREGNVRYLGPNCMGIICPHTNLNASFAAHSARPGSLALLSQSGAICSATLDWAVSEKIGFSHFVSIGSMADIDFGDMIDYLGNNEQAKSIIIYMENLTNHRKFMSAARSVSRVKPIIVAKSGRSPAAARAAASHTGAMAGQDEAYNALFRRAGIIRVDTVSQLFSCAEALGKTNRPLGGNLAIITNAGGPGVMAVDEFSRWNEEPVTLSEETKTRLNEFLPPHWSRGNPIDIIGDAPPERYLKTLQVCLQAPEVSGVVMILSPQAMTDPTAVAQEIIQELTPQAKPIFAVWMGAQEVAEGIRILNEGGIPTFLTPEEAIDTFMQMYSYTKNLALLQETPPQSPQDIQVNNRQARSFIDECLKRQLYTLSEIEAKAILSAYGIPVNRTVSVSSAQVAAEAAAKIGFPVVAKIHSYDISHKSDVDGVRVNLKTPQEVQEAFEEITSKARELRPEAKILGVTVQNQVQPANLELILGCNQDPLFGPLLLFGMGGILTEIYRDTAVALPPLNLHLAKRLMQYPRIFKILQGYRSIPPANLDQLAEILVRLSQLVTDFSEILELDINPLLISNGQCIAVDARIVIAEATVPAPRHLIIAPYPNQYEISWLLKDGTPILLRPMKPEDEALVEGLLRHCSEETLYFRYFRVLRDFPHSFLIRFTQNDYDREIGLAAIGAPPGPEVMMGVGRLVMTPERDQAEFAVIVADPWHGKGLGEKLIEEVINIARDYGVKTVWGEILASNEPMLGLVRKLGFAVLEAVEGLRRVELTL
ncbi:MAG: bifunctional acetate--CoA ligase family protein/GNAT family N-acetyltransferase [Deltaproteobacteria bacterium]|nr:bifunctional acetate--CoA ligase family protein/GNAT family N-acetyltransferase [Deltaproteobacteria bacterium]